MRAKQILTVIEPPRLQAVGRLPDGTFQMQITSWPGFNYAIETSTNLTTWTPWMTLTTTNRITRIVVPAASDLKRFYRVEVIP